MLIVVDCLINKHNLYIISGRTNATRLHYQVRQGEMIKYVDFTSLYPWVNKYCKYPVGHPSIISSDFRSLDQYFGIAKVKALPPRGLYHPVLPYRSAGKLTFPLCRTCADLQSSDVCTCTDVQRSITGTWCTPELVLAVECGYTILKVYEVCTLYFSCWCIFILFFQYISIYIYIYIL